MTEPAEEHELDALHQTSAPMPPEDVADVALHDEQLHKRTLRKLDFLLLPFLALLFLFNSLDKSNVRRSMYAPVRTPETLLTEDSTDRQR